MIVESDYRGWRIEVEAVAENGRYQGDMRMRRLFSRGQAAARGGHLLQADAGSPRARGPDMGEAMGRCAGLEGKARMAALRLTLVLSVMVLLILGLPRTSHAQRSLPDEDLAIPLALLAYD